MELFGIGPLEFLLIVLLMMVVLGPRDMVTSAQKAGRFIRKVIKSPMWSEVLDVQREIRDLPTRLVNESGLEEDIKYLKEAAKEPGIALSEIKQEVSSAVSSANPNQILPSSYEPPLMGSSNPEPIHPEPTRELSSDGPAEQPDLVLQPEVGSSENESILAETVDISEAALPGASADGLGSLPGEFDVEMVLPEGAPVSEIKAGLPSEFELHIAAPIPATFTPNIPPNGLHPHSQAALQVVPPPISLPQKRIVFRPRFKANRNR